MFKIVNKNNNWHQNKHKLVVRCYCTNDTKDEKIKEKQSNFDKYIKIFPKIKEQLRNKDFQQYLRFKTNSKSQRTSSTALTEKSTDRFEKVGLVDVAKSKLYEIQNFYDEFSGMSEVKVAQRKVIDIQDQLQVVQERRRHILLELTLTRQKLRDLHIELQKYSRGEHRYVELVREEYDVLANEKDRNQLFQIIDQEERDLFSHLTTAVKSSHEKERTQANNTKYWSLIGSFIGALLGIVGTMVNYRYRSSQFENILKNCQENQKEVLKGKEILLKFESDYKEIAKNNYASVKSVLNKMDQIESDIAIIRFHLQKNIEEKMKLKNQVNQESWGAYLKRHSYNIVSYVIPFK